MKKGHKNKHKHGKVTRKEKKEKKEGNRFYIWLIVALCLIVSVVYLVSAGKNWLGYPLDDTYIHLVYIENFAEHGWFYFNYPEPEGGATSPLWVVLNGTVVFALGWLLPATFLVKLMSIVFFVLGGVLFYLIIFKLIKKRAISFVLSLLFVLDPHVSMAGVSGMEVSMLITIMLACVYFYIREERLLVGVMAGLAVWARPEGGLLCLIVGIVYGMKWMVGKEKFWNAAKVAGPMVLLVGLFFVFNLVLSDGLMPNTYYAKKAAADWWNSTAYENIIRGYFLETPIFFVLLGFLFLGAGIWWLYKKEKFALGMVAGTGLVYMYALTLTLPILNPPWVFYMSRYFTPMIPLLLLLTGLGMYSVFMHIKHLKRKIALAGVVVLVVLQCVFLLKSVGLYSASIDYFDGLMGEQGRWFRENAPDATVATFDVGALKYIGGNELIDLQRLNNKNLIVRDVEDGKRLREYVNGLEIDYIAMTPQTMPYLVQTDAVEVVEKYPLCPEGTRYPCKIRYKDMGEEGLEDMDHVLIYKVKDQDAVRKAMTRWFAEFYAWISAGYYRHEQYRKVLVLNAASYEIMPSIIAGGNAYTACKELKNKECMDYFIENMKKDFPEVKFKG